MSRQAIHQALERGTLQRCVDDAGRVTITPAEVRRYDQARQRHLSHSRSGRGVVVVADDRQWLTSVEVAAMAGVAAVTVRSWRAKGDLPAEKRGRDWLFDRAVVEAFLLDRAAVGS